MKKIFYYDLTKNHLANSLKAAFVLFYSLTSLITWADPPGEWTLTAEPGGLYCNTTTNPKLKLEIDNGFQNEGRLDFYVEIWDEANQVFKNYKYINHPFITYTGNSNIQEFEFANSSVISKQTVNQATSTRSEPWNRIDGKYRLRVLYHISKPNPNVSPITGYSPEFVVIEGAKPRFQIADKTEALTWTNIPTMSTVLKGCVNNIPHVRLDPNQCGTESFFMFVQETDKNGVQAIGPLADRALTAAEATALRLDNGLAIDQFSDGNDAVVLSTDRYYKVGLTYTGMGNSKSSYVVFHYKEGTWDLVLKDNTNDLGFEPVSQWDNDVFDAPSLWNKLSTTTDQNTKDHEPITFSHLGNHNKLFVEIENIGCQWSSPNEELRLFWTIARTDELYEKHWTNNPGNWENMNGTNRLMGCEITIADPHDYYSASDPITLPPIAAKSTYVIPWSQGAEWYPPDNKHYNDPNLGGGAEQGRPTICLLARINESYSTDDPIEWEPNGYTDKILPYVKENNNVSTRNAVLVDNPDFFLVGTGGNSHSYGDVSLQVNNGDDVSQVVDLCYTLVPAYPNQTFSDYGIIDLKVNTDLYNRWVLSGSNLTNLIDIGNNTFRVVNDANFCLDGVLLPASYIAGQISIRHEFDHGLPNPATEDKFYYVFTQQNTTTLEFGSNSVFTFEVPTSYANLPSTDGPGWDDGSEPEEQVAGISNKESTMLALVPNPAQSVFIIQSDNTGNGIFNKVEILDVSGKVIRSFQNMNTNESYDVSNLSKGVYMVRVEQNGEKNTIKLVLE